MDDGLDESHREIRLNHLQEFIAGKGFGKVIGGATGFRFRLVQTAGVAADHDDRDIGKNRTAPQNFTKPITINSWHRNIHQNEVRFHVEQS